MHNNGHGRDANDDSGRSGDSGCGEGMMGLEQQRLLHRRRWPGWEQRSVAEGKCGGNGKGYLLWGMKAMLVLVVVSVCATLGVQGARHIPGLYDGDNTIVRLDEASLDQHVLGGQGPKGQGNGPHWLVEFYASWCGGCQNFAPAWRSLAQRLNTWRDVLHVAAINCGDEANQHVCQRHKITGYPVIKVFPPTARTPADGVVIERGDIAFMETEVAELLQGSISNDARLEPFRSVEQVVEASREGAIPIVAVVEPPTSTVGLRLILHFWSASSVARVVRVHEIPSASDDDASEGGRMRVGKNTHEEQEQQQKEVERQQEGCSIEVFKRGQRVSEVGCDADERTDVVGLILDELTQRLGLHLPRLDHTIGKNVTATTTATARASYFSHPHASDLITTLHHMLAVEAASREKLTDREVQVLRAMARAASNLPLPSEMTSNLARIASWLEARGAVSRRTWQSLMERYPLLPEGSHGWRQCAGSQPHFRGYPCGLWTLFHTLTVNVNSHKGDAAALAFLDVVAGYVDLFFGCRGCARHFMRMYKQRQEYITAIPESLSSERAVLWLWHAHNAANARLATDTADISTDPHFPKQLFPSRRQCPKCYVAGDESDFSDVSWRLPAVARFLRDFYGTIIVDEEHQGAGGGGSSSDNRQHGRPNVSGARNGGGGLHSTQHREDGEHKRRHRDQERQENDDGEGQDGVGGGIQRGREIPEDAAVRGAAEHRGKMRFEGVQQDAQEGTERQRLRDGSDGSDEARQRSQHAPHHVPQLHRVETDGDENDNEQRTKQQRQRQREEEQHRHRLSRAATVAHDSHQLLLVYSAIIIGVGVTVAWVLGMRRRTGTSGFTKSIKQV